jgi:hypothetical protein
MLTRTSGNFACDARHPRMADLQVDLERQLQRSRRQALPANLKFEICINSIGLTAGGNYIKSALVNVSPILQTRSGNLTGTALSGIWGL